MSEQSQDGESQAGESQDMQPKGQEQPLLSGEETDALLGAMREGEKDIPADDIDLTSPDRPIQSALPWADTKTGALCVGFRKLLYKQLNVNFTVNSIQPEATPWGQVREDLAPNSALGCTETEDGGRLWVILDPTTTRGILNRRLGLNTSETPANEGEGDPEAETDGNSESEALETRPLSQVDRGILRSAFDHWAESAGIAWCDRQGAFRAKRVFTSPDALPEIDNTKPFLSIAFDILIGEQRKGRVLLIFDAEAVVSTVPKETKEETPSNESETEKLVHRIMNAEVEISATLGQSDTSIREILALKLGDVVRLDSVPGTPIDTFVDDAPVFRGLPTVHHGNLAIECVALIERNPS